MQLRELFEGILRVPQEQLDKIDALYTRAMQDLPKIIKRLNHVTNSAEFIASFPKYRGYFSLTKVDTGKQVPIDVKFLIQDEKEEAAFGPMAGAIVMVINVAWLVKTSRENFKETIHHELVHAHDPKSQTPLLTDKMTKYWQQEFDRGSVGPKLDIHGGIDVYLTSLHEFDAFTTASLARLRRYIDAQSEEKRLKIRLELLKKLRSGWLATPDDNLMNFLPGFGDIFKQELRQVPRELTQLLDNANVAWKKTDTAEGRKKLRVRRNLFRTFLKRAYQELIA